jgi:cytochrome P450
MAGRVVALRTRALSNALVFRRDPLTFLKHAAEQGDVTAFRLAGRSTLFVNDPATIADVLVTEARHFRKGWAYQQLKIGVGEGLLTAEGQTHLRARRLIQPGFHRQRMARYAETMVGRAEGLRSTWRDGAIRDLHADMMRLTLTIAAETLFSADIEREGDELRGALADFLEVFDQIFIPFGNIVARLPLPGPRRIRRAGETFDRIVYRIIAERRHDGIDRGDLLSMLLMAVDTEGDGTGLNDRQLRDEVITLLLAGHETTANALTWTWLLLAQHPAVQEELHAEADTVLGSRLPTIDDLPRLPVHGAVLAEALRLYPPAWLIAREAMSPCVVGGIEVGKGMTVLLSPYTTHRHARYWEDPERFDPARWTPAARATRPRFAYFPFGGGNRVCVGESFALIEATLVLATLAQRYKVALLSDQRVVLEPLVTLRPKGGLRMLLQERVSPDRRVPRQSSGAEIPCPEFRTH